MIKPKRKDFKSNEAYDEALELWWEETSMASPTEMYNGEECEVTQGHYKCDCCKERKEDEFLITPSQRILCRGCVGY